MISPASRKNGTAISGKLSAPFSTFCATIWASNRSIYIISAAPLMMSAKATGTPSAIGTRRAARKMSKVIVGAPYLRSSSVGTGVTCSSLSVTKCVLATSMRPVAMPKPFHAMMSSAGTAKASPAP